MIPAAILGTFAAIMLVVALVSAGLVSGVQALDASRG